MKRKILTWLITRLIQTPLGRAMVTALLKTFIKQLRDTADKRYGYVLNSQKLPVSGGGPRWDYVCNFLDGNFDEQIKTFIDHEL